MTDLLISGKLALYLVALLGLILIFGIALFKMFIKGIGLIMRKAESNHLNANLDYIQNRTKYKRYDVFQFFKPFFFVGLITSLCFSLVAFNWTIEKSLPIAMNYTPEAMEEIELTPRTIQEDRPKPIPIPDKIEIVEIEDIETVEPEFIEDIIDAKTEIAKDVNPTKQPIIRIPAKEEKKAPTLPLPEIAEEPPVVIAERMPCFPGCSTLATEQERKACSSKKLLLYVYSQLSYPQMAIEHKIEGMAIIQFVVMEDGRIANAKIVRDPGMGTANAALKVVNKMNDLDEKWSPGKQRGRPVKVLYTLPVKFELRD